MRGEQAIVQSNDRSVDALISRSEESEKKIVSSSIRIMQKPVERLIQKRAIQMISNETKEGIGAGTKKAVRLTVKKAASQAGKEAVKQTAKVAAREVAKETGKQAAKAVATETSKVIVSSSTTVIGSGAGTVGGAAAGTVITPGAGTLVGIVIGAKVGHAVGESAGYGIQQADSFITTRNAVMKNFMIANLTQPETPEEAKQKLGSNIMKVLLSEAKRIGSLLHLQSAKLLLPVVAIVFMVAFVLLVAFTGIVTTAAGIVDVLSGYSADNYYCQYEEPWASYPYGKQTISSSGCGPTTFAMVISTMTETQMNPAEAADYFEEKGYCLVEDSGNTLTKWTGFTSGVTDYGLTCTSSGTNLEDALTILSEGGMIVCSVGNSANDGKGNALYNGDGHFLAIRGISEDGNLLLLDPASRKNTEMEWDPATVQEILKQCWKISVSGE